MTAKWVGFVALITLGNLQGLGPIRILAEDVPTTRAIRELSSAYPYPIQFDLMPYDQMVQKANLDLTTGTGEYDIILQYNTALANYIENHYVVSLRELRKKFPDRLVDGIFPFEKELFQECWKEIGWFSEEAYVLPFSANTMILAYNKELFSDESYRKEYREKYQRDLEPPETWEEFKQIADFFHRPDQKIYGTCLQGAPNFTYYEWANFAYSMGNGIMQKTYGWEGNKKTPLLLTTPATVEATKVYLGLKQYDASDDFFKTDATTQIQILKNKKVALALVWSDVAYALAYENGNLLGTYDFCPIPGKVSMLAGGSFYINRQGKNVEAAIQFVLDQMDQEKQIALMQLGLCSPLQNVYEQDEVKNIPYANALKTSLNRGIYMLEAGSDSQVIIDIMSNTLQKLMNTSANERVVEALDAATREIEERRDKF